jgi:hypothetical protein
MKYFLILILALTSCSADWHLKKAAKKNPKLLDSNTIYVPYRKDTTIYVQIPGDTSETNKKFLEWYNKARDSSAVVFQDSILKIKQSINQDGTVTTTVIRVPYEVPFEVIIRDTIPVNVPPQIIIETKTPNFIWILVLITLILLLLLLHRYKK